MSIEFQLAHRCPHLTVEESVSLDTDRRGLQIRQPVGNTGSVLIQVVSDSSVQRSRTGTDAESFYVPPGGLLSPAQLTSSVSGPFLIEKCPDTFNLTLSSSSESVSLALPIGLQVTTSQLVEYITPRVQDIFVENVNGYLVFTDVAKLGPESRIRVSGTAAETLGFGTQYGANGAIVFPAWRLEKRSDIRTDLNLANRYPKFVSQVRQDANFRVTYSTPANRCLRCRATFVENDYRFNVQGEPLLIENEDLLYQAALKILLTTLRSNPFHQFYGSRVKSRIGTKAIGAVATQLSEDVRTALNNMQTLQREQAKYQRVTSKERLYSVLSVDVLPHENDPTAFLIDIVVANASGQPVNLSIVFTVPGAFALQGSNGLSLGLDVTGLSDEELSQLFS